MTQNQGVQHPAATTRTKLMEACELRKTRASGPGGQHRNKVETAIELVHLPSGISAAAAERRSQDANRRVAEFRLRIQLAIRLRTVTSAEVHPSPLWQERCRGQKIICSDRHTDFPGMLAEALNAIDAKEYDVRRAAAALGCSTTQLVRFVARVPEALEQVNQERGSRGLRRLKP